MNKIKAECQDQLSDSMIKVEELKRKAVFVNHKRESFVRTRVDKCVIVNDTAADFVVTKCGVGDIIVELKESGIEHGVKQIIETATMWVNGGHACGKLAGLIIGHQRPAAAPTVQRAQNAFNKKFRGPLHIVNRNTEFNFEKVLSFKGPL
jgi:hypothetical protein